MADSCKSEPNRPPEQWRRLTKKEATNYLITALILRGFDPNGELVIDGDPGPFLQKCVNEYDLEAIHNRQWPPGHKSREYPAEVIGVQGWHLFGFSGIKEIGEQIGFRGKWLRELVEYLRNLSEEGPIG